jgi:hypothetical protein
VRAEKTHTDRSDALGAERGVGTTRNASQSR